VRQPRGQKLEHRLARRALELGQRLRLDLLPRHYCSQVGELARVLQGYWPVRRDRGIALDPLNGDRHWPSPLYLERTGGAD
jgi:hypothetical protein